MKILIVLASKNFRDEEYAVPRKIWEKEGIHVSTTSSTVTSTGRFGLKVKNDLLLDEARAEYFDAIFWVGGGGCLEYLENKTAETLAKSFVAVGKPVAAICAAPRLLLKWGILKGKKFTGWNGDSALEKMGKEAGAHFTSENVTVEKRFVTADGPESAEKCAKDFLKILK